MTQQQTRKEASLRRITANNNDRDFLFLLRSRDVPFAYAILLLLTFLTISSMAWFWLANDDLVSTRLSVPKNTSAKFRVDINRATWPEIANLPKVGPSLAKAVVEHRETHGPFNSVLDLTNVVGIGPKKLVAISPLLVPLEQETEVK